MRIEPGTHDHTLTSKSTPHVRTSRHSVALNTCALKRVMCVLSLLMQPIVLLGGRFAAFSASRPDKEYAPVLDEDLLSRCDVCHRSRSCLPAHPAAWHRPGPCDGVPCSRPTCRPGASSSPTLCWTPSLGSVVPIMTLSRSASFLQP